MIRLLELASTLKVESITVPRSCDQARLELWLPVIIAECVRPAHFESIHVEDIDGMSEEALRQLSQIVTPAIHARFGVSAFRQQPCHTKLSTVSGWQNLSHLFIDIEPRWTKPKQGALPPTSLRQLSSLTISLCHKQLRDVLAGFTVTSLTQLYIQLDTSATYEKVKARHRHNVFDVLREVRIFVYPMNPWPRVSFKHGPCSDPELNWIAGGCNCTPLHTMFDHVSIVNNAFADALNKHYAKEGLP
jgi:hypothetical protein